ncbi:unnamed protein product, partial [Mycena citricolor]
MLEEGIRMDQPDLGWRCWGGCQIHADEFTATTQLLHTHILLECPLLHHSLSATLP